MAIHGLTSAVVVFISVPVLVLGTDILQIRGNTEVAEAFRLVCSSPLNTSGPKGYTFFRSSTPGVVGTDIGSIGYLPNTSPLCSDRGIGEYLIPYPFGCEDNGTRGYITINVTTGTDLTEHDKYWRCQTVVDAVAANNNEVHIIIYDPVKTVQIVSEDGTTLNLPVVISESNTNTKLLCTTGSSGSRPEAQLTWWRTGTPNPQITYGVTVLTGQNLTGEHVTARSTLNIANRAFNGVSVFCKANLNGNDTQSDQVLLSVTYKPEVEVRAGNVKYTSYIIAEDQQNVQFNCTVTSANPSTGISYNWLRDGLPIPGVTGQIYSITKVQKADRGMLTCTATNTEGTTTSSGVNVDVQYQAAIAAMQDVTLEEGTTLTQICEADGNPLPSFRWTFGGGEVSSSATLRINSITSEQNGTYTCHASNTLTPTGQTNISRETRATIHVTVYFGPKNVIPSQTDVNITVGQTDSSVSCTATCNPACTYRWLKDGNQVNLGSMLQLKSVSKSHAGNYYCEASNTFPNKTAKKVSTVAVIVNVMFSPEVQLKPEPNIKPTPDPYSILLGQNNVGLRCEVVVSNPPPSSYTWTVNNSVIVGAVQETYTITMVTLQTAGTYRCRGNNGISDPAYSTLVLDVQYGPVIVPIINQTKEEGTSLSVPCQYTSNPTTDQVSWTKVNNNTFSKTQNSLSIINLHRSDRGMYRCSVTNTLHLSGSGKPNEPKTATREFYLDVQYQPSITSLHVEGNNVVSQNDTVKIVCEIDSNPTSTFTWIRQSDLASLPEKGNMLTLSSVQCSDSTFFTCTANNNIGSAATKNVQLFVKCPPRIDSIAPQETAYGAVGESINITVQHIIAFPPPTFIWTKVNSDTLPPSNQTNTNTSSTLTVRRLDVDDFGSYSVTIDNSIGQPFVFYIEVESASHPLKPTNVAVIASTTNSVILSWTPGFDGGAAQNFSIQYRIDVGSDFSNYSKTFRDENSQPMTAAVDGLEGGNVYYFRLIAINRFGESPVTEETRAVTKANVAKPESIVGPVIGGAIGCVVVGALGMLAAIYLWRRYQERRTKSQATPNRTEERGNDSTYQDLTQNRSASKSEYQTLNLSEQATPVYLNLELNVASTSRTDPHYQNLTHN